MRYLSLIVFLFYGCNPPAPQKLEVKFVIGNPNSVCGAVVTAPCSQMDTILDVTSNTVVSSTIPASATSYELTTLPSAGDHLYQITFNGVDQDGNPITSPPVSTTVLIP